jgi:hypothetical protein
MLMMFSLFSEFLPTDGDRSFLDLLYPSHVGPGCGRNQDAGLLLDPTSFLAHWRYPRWLRRG